MTIDARYVLADLQEYFVDKDTGLPLSGGIVTFYEDIARTTLKPIYTIGGSPPNYSYTQLPNPLTLSSVGTPMDASGNDVLIYYFPYQGIPEVSTGVVDLYYVTVQSAGEVDQFERQAVPNFSLGSDINANNNVNFIPNGQFLAHLNVPPTLTTPAGQITQAVTDIAWGGWTFERPSGSSSVDNVSFSRYGSITDNPTGNPRYALVVTTSQPGVGDDFKNVCVKFKNVNTFTVPTTTPSQDYTFSFSGMTLNSSSLPVTLAIIQYYGAGGSATRTTQIGNTITLTPSEQTFSVIFSFPNNDTASLGLGDDDYVQIAIQLPSNSGLSVSITDAALALGNAPVSQFPVQTVAEIIYGSVAGWLDTPAADGSNLYLSPVMTPGGMSYDTSNIGKVFANSYQTVEPNELKCDGTQYLTAGYSEIGIPYSRLQAKLFTSLGAIASAYIDVPRYGTGLNYFTSWNNTVGATNEVVIYNNSPGVVTPTADGTVATGFTFAAVHTGIASGFAITPYWDPGANPSIWVTQNVIGSTGSPTNGNSGFTTTLWRADNAEVAQIFTVQPTAATSLASTYFTFDSTTNDYYVWFKVNGSGTDPAPGGTGILISLNSTDNLNNVALKIVNSLIGGQVSSVKVLAGSSVVPNSYFTINSINQGFYVWYSLNGQGIDPKLTDLIGIPVPYTAVQTAAQVAQATQLAINSQYFATPRFEGAFLRGVDPNEILDIGGLRLSTVTGIAQNVVGTYEWDDNQYHSHTFSALLGTSNTQGTSGTDFPDTLTESTTSVNGYYDAKPRNFSVNWVIKY